MSAVPVAEKVLPGKNESEFSVLQLHKRKRFLAWLNLWCSSLIGDFLSMSARR